MTEDTPRSYSLLSTNLDRFLKLHTLISDNSTKRLPVEFFVKNSPRPEVIEQVRGDAE